MTAYVFCPEIARAKHYSAIFKLIVMQSDDGSTSFGLRKIRHAHGGEIVKLGKFNVPASVAREFALAILRETDEEAK